jgi:hypothetical protein
MRRGWAALALLALPTATLVGTVATGQALEGEEAGRRVETTTALAIRPFQAVPGEPVEISASVTPAVQRRVVLQQRAGSRWVTVASARTAADGTHAFLRDTPKTSTTYRVRAPRATVGRTTYDADTSPRRTLTALRQGVIFRIAETAEAGSSVSAIAEASPRRAGRPVALQRRTGSTWTTIEIREQDVRGLVTWLVPTPEPGELVHRVVVRPWNGAAAVRSGTRRTTVE